MGNLQQAARSGDKRKTLEQLRSILAYNIETCDSKRDIAALSRRLIEVCEMLDAMPSPDDSDPVDEMAKLIAEYDEYEDPREDGGG